MENSTQKAQQRIPTCWAFPMFPAVASTRAHREGDSSSRTFPARPTCATAELPGVTMSAMGSHDVHAERRRRYVYLCDGCGTAYEDLADAYDCEASHEG